MSEERREFLERLHAEVVRMKNGKKYKFGECPNYADKDSQKSVLLGKGVEAKLPGTRGTGDVTGQRSGSLFEIAVKDFLERTFTKLGSVRPGKWIVWQSVENAKKGEGGGGPQIKDVTSFEQYSYLAALSEIIEEHHMLRDVVGQDYIVKPDVVIARWPEEDERINRDMPVVDDSTALSTPLRKRNNETPILHATVSCKWTMRSDRSQNSRTEALNLIRKRKGHLPHIVIVTMEPLPSRLASIAIGTGDIDCVYHAALYELMETARELHETGKLDLDDLQLLESMCEGKRLRDISDLPLDLAI